MPLDDIKTDDTTPPPLARTFASPGKRYLAVYFAPPSWGDPSPYKAWSQDPDDPGVLRFIKEEDLGSIALFNPAKAQLPDDCIAIAIFEESGKSQALFMFGEVISSREGAAHEIFKAQRNGIEIYNLTGNPYVKRGENIASIYRGTDLVLHPDTREVLWTRQKGIIQKPSGTTP